VAVHFVVQVENKKGSGDYLPPVDHSLVEYDDFAKVGHILGVSGYC